MGKIETLGVVVAVVGVLGSQSVDRLPEEALITTPKALIGMSHARFEAWCGNQGDDAHVTIDRSDDAKITCAWLDEQTGRVWHAALRFEEASARPYRADAGLVDASRETLLRLVLNEHGVMDGETQDGFPAWQVDIDDTHGLLSVADYGEITIARLEMPQKGVTVSSR